MGNNVACRTTNTRSRRVLTFESTMVLLGVCCVVLLVGFSYREQRWGPWVMLVAVVSLLALMAYSIVALLPGV